MRDKEQERITKLYSKYLNGPLGIGVMSHLEEGESFTIKSEDEIVRISKQNGKAIVRIITNDEKISELDGKQKLEIHQKEYLKS